MAINILETVQENLGYAPLHHVDPNTQQVETDPAEAQHRLGQGVIPATLAAVYKYSRKEEGAEAILHADLATDWTNYIFNDNREEAIAKMTAYSGHENSEVVSNINRVAREAVRQVRKEAGDDASTADVKRILKDSRNDILPYLPAELQMGNLLDDTTIDDRTNKMEGPVSSLMHAIGDSFSGSDGDEINQK